MADELKSFLRSADVSHMIAGAPDGYHVWLTTKAEITSMTLLKIAVSTPKNLERLVAGDGQNRVRNFFVEDFTDAVNNYEGAAAPSVNDDGHGGGDGTNNNSIAFGSNQGGESSATTADPPHYRNEDEAAALPIQQNNDDSSPPLPVPNNNPPPSAASKNPPTHEAPTRPNTADIRQITGSKPITRQKTIHHDEQQARPTPAHVTFVCATGTKSAVSVAQAVNQSAPNSTQHKEGVTKQLFPDTAEKDQGSTFDSTSSDSSRSPMFDPNEDVQFVGGGDDDDDDDDYATEVLPNLQSPDTPLAKSKPLAPTDASEKNSTALGFLLADYGSSSESDEEDNNNTADNSSSVATLDVGEANTAQEGTQVQWKPMTVEINQWDLHGRAKDPLQVTIKCSEHLPPPTGRIQPNPDIVMKLLYIEEQNFPTQKGLVLACFYLSRLLDDDRELTTLMERRLRGLIKPTQIDTSDLRPYLGTDMTGYLNYLGSRMEDKHDWEMIIITAVAPDHDPPRSSPFLMNHYLVRNILRAMLHFTTMKTMTKSQNQSKGTHFCGVITPVNEDGGELNCEEAFDPENPTDPDKIEDEGDRRKSTFSHYRAGGKVNPLHKANNRNFDAKLARERAVFALMTPEEIASFKVEILVDSFDQWNGNREDLLQKYQCAAIQAYIDVRERDDLSIDDVLARIAAGMASVEGNETAAAAAVGGSAAGEAAGGGEVVEQSSSAQAEPRKTKVDLTVDTNAFDTILENSNNEDEDMLIAGINLPILRLVQVLIDASFKQRKDLYQNMNNVAFSFISVLSELSLLNKAFGARLKAEATEMESMVDMNGGIGSIIKFCDKKASQKDDDQPLTGLVLELKQAIYQAKTGNNNDEVKAINDSVKDADVKKHLRMGFETRNLLMHVLNLYFITTLLQELKIGEIFQYLSKESSLITDVKELAQRFNPAVNVDEEEMTALDFLLTIALPAMERADLLDEAWKVVCCMLCHLNTIQSVGNKASSDARANDPRKKLLALFRKVECQSVNGVDESAVVYWSGEGDTYGKRRKFAIRIFAVFLLRKFIEKSLPMEFSFKFGFTRSFLCLSASSIGANCLFIKADTYSRCKGFISTQIEALMENNEKKSDSGVRTIFIRGSKQSNSLKLLLDAYNALTSTTTKS